MMHEIEPVPINPFKPTAGAEPPILIGRDRVISDFQDALLEGTGAPGRLMRITGPRGSGKTVLLTELGDMARKRGWRVIDVTAGDHLLEDIISFASAGIAAKSAELQADFGPIKAHASLASADGSAELRKTLMRLASGLQKKGAGLLVTVDEIQDADEGDVRELAATVQHLIRERMDIAFLFAGLTTGVMDVLNGKALTFLRRAKPEELGAIPLDEVRQSMRQTMNDAGLAVEDDALDYLVPETEGYAYLIQLVGYCVFASARRHAQDARVVTLEDARQGVEEAFETFASSVQEAAVAGISERAMRYLLAMSRGGRNVRTAWIAEQMGLEPSLLTSTRRSLIQAQVIEAPSRGIVRFAIPHMAKFLQENEETLLSRY